MKRQKHLEPKSSLVLLPAEELSNETSQVLGVEARLRLKRTQANHEHNAKL
jgi:hypothetical protein